jgi:hypothetical protein
MRNLAGFFVTAATLLGVACGGTTAPPDMVEGGADASTGADTSTQPDVSADASGVLDVAPDAASDRGGGDVLAKWQKLGLVRGSGPCPTDSCSSSWDVTPDGHIAKILLGDAGVAQMTSTDLVELDSIVSSKAFVDGMMSGFVCDAPPTDVFVSLRLERDGTSQTQGVTGCVYSGPPGNLPRRVNDLVTKY